ncbi:hypothetical protein DL96DRAFT_1603419, partial [Flagelloscypha sp. PMI_526]
VIMQLSLIHHLGLKAAVHNESYSDDTRQNASARLAEMGINEPFKGNAHFVDADTEHEHRRLGGFKATLSNPNTSDEAKNRASEILAAADSNREAASAEHDVRVLAGYKAALHNPRVSTEAKAHAEQVLRENGEL